MAYFHVPLKDASLNNKLSVNKEITSKAAKMMNDESFNSSANAAMFVVRRSLWDRTPPDAGAPRGTLCVIFT